MERNSVSFWSPRKNLLWISSTEPIGFDDTFFALHRRNKRRRFCSGLGLCGFVLRCHEDMPFRWPWPLWMWQDRQRPFVQRLPVGWLFGQRGLRGGIRKKFHRRWRAAKRKEGRRDTRQPTQYQHRIQGKWGVVAHWMIRRLSSEGSRVRIRL